MSSKKARMKIGAFEMGKDGLMHGRVGGLGFNITDVVLQPATSRNGLEYFKIVTDPLLDAFQVGVAFTEQIEKDGETINFHSVTLDSPMFPKPISAALFPSNEYAGHYNLLWNRYEATPKAEAKADMKAEATPTTPAATTKTAAKPEKKAGANGKPPGKPGAKRHDASLRPSP